MHEAAVIAALILAEHRDHLAVHARAILYTSGDDPNRRVARKALEAWVTTPPRLARGRLQSQP